MVVGRRTGKAVDPGLFRRFSKFALRKLAEHLSRETIPDFNSGLRIAKKSLVLRAQGYLPDGFSFTTTLTLFMLSTNQPIIYVPIDYYKRQGKSKIRPIRDTLNFIQLIIRTIMFFNPLRVFLPLSLLFMALSLIVVVVSYLLGKSWTSQPSSCLSRVFSSSPWASWRTSLTNAWVNEDPSDQSAPVE